MKKRGNNSRRNDPVLKQLTKFTRRDVLFWHQLWPGNNYVAWMANFVLNMECFSGLPDGGPRVLAFNRQNKKQGPEWEHYKATMLLRAIKQQQNRHKGLRLSKQAELLRFMKEGFSSTTKSSRPPQGLIKRA